jgi:hypothetical protein
MDMINAIVRPVLPSVYAVIHPKVAQRVLFEHEYAASVQMRRNNYYQVFFFFLIITCSQPGGGNCRNSRNVTLDVIDGDRGHLDRF